MSVQRIAGPKQMSETTTVKEILAQSIQLGVVSLARLDSETPRPPKVEKVKDEKGKTVTKTVERPLTFSGGSLGFTGSGKVEVREGERYQVTVTAVLIGSKPIE